MQAHRSQLLSRFSPVSRMGLRSLPVGHRARWSLISLLLLTLPAGAHAQSTGDFGPQTSWLGIFANPPAVEDRTTLVVELGMRCPGGSTVMGFDYDAYWPADSTGGLREFEVSPSQVPLPGGEVFLQSIRFDPTTSPGAPPVCTGRGTIFLAPEISVRARCSSETQVWRSRLPILVKVGCDQQGPLIHESSIKVEPGDPPKEPPPAYVEIFSSVPVEAPDEIDDAYGTALGLRLGFGLTLRSSLELSASRRDLEPSPGNPYLAGSSSGALLTADLAWIYRWRSEGRLRPLTFLAAGWQVADAPPGSDLGADSFAPSTGLGFELDLSNRIFLDARLSARWIEQLDEDAWVTEAQLGLGYRF